MIYTKSFWKSATERAIKTATQAALPALGLAFASAGDLVGANWADFAVMVLGATILSYLTSLVSGIKDGNPSLGNQEVVVPGAEVEESAVAHSESYEPEGSNVRRLEDTNELGG